MPPSCRRPAVEATLCDAMVALMRDTDASTEPYARFGLVAG
jgi:hypothetical protein